ncbi:alpha/beta hydrolase [uncultured Aquincola sp.]|uniref:alpha/beta fold hydrolase n=1 Tax=uncultured Aquincola sp. TaxID=886556 RepID=UPI0032B2EEB4
MNVLARHNVRRLGAVGHRPLVFAHGYGCDQQVWQHITPAFEADHELLLFDYVGSGGSDTSAYDRQRHGSLEGHARDLIALCEAAGLQRPVLVAHSVSTMVGVLAARLRPDLFEGLALVAPNPCYINHPGYVGGFERHDVDDLMDVLDQNFFSWARMMAPVIMGNPGRPELGDALANSFCSVDPSIARHFARVTFLADHRADLPQVHTPCLLMQCTDDALAPPAVGEYLQHALPQAELVQLAATGHCPHLSAPAETTAALQRFLARLPERAVA